MDLVVGIPEIGSHFYKGNIVGSGVFIRTDDGYKYRYGGRTPEWANVVVSAAIQAKQPLAFEYSHSIKGKIYYGVPKSVRNAAEWIAFSQKAAAEIASQMDRYIAERISREVSSIVEWLKERYDQIEIDMEALVNAYTKCYNSADICLNRKVLESDPGRVVIRFLTRDAKVAEITYDIINRTGTQYMSASRSSAEAERLAQ